jgi:2-haloacid dehalogenase
MKVAMPLPSIDALTFDVFGTVADWKGTIVAEGKRIARGRLPGMNWEAFAETWAIAYGKTVARMVEWVNLDVLLATAYDRIAPGFGLEVLAPGEGAELSRVWSRLRPWPDAVTGFARLHRRSCLAALTNANVAMLDDLARATGLPWDRLFSAESVRCYKPAADVYLMALDRLGLPAGRVMMVASHTYDVNAAHRLGMRTALIRRESEWGSDVKDLDHEPEIIANDLEDFARTLTGAP